MKKLIYAFMALATLAMAGCKDKNGPEEKKDIEIKKVADYLYEYEAGDYGTVAPAYVMSDDGRYQRCRTGLQHQRGKHGGY